MQKILIRGPLLILLFLSINQANAFSWARLVNLQGNQIFLEYQPVYNTRYDYAGTMRWVIDPVLMTIIGHNQTGAERNQPHPPQRIDDDIQQGNNTAAQVQAMFTNCMTGFINANHIITLPNLRVCFNNVFNQL